MTPPRPAVPVLKLTRAWCFLLYAALSGLCGVVHNRLVDAAAVDARKQIHGQVLRNTAAAPLQYRVMTFYASEGLQRLMRAAGAEDPFRLAYLLLRVAATFLGAVLLHRFLEIYLPLPATLAGTLLAFAWLPLTYINYFMQETDPLNLVFFLAGYGLIRKRRDAALAGLTAAAMLNRETPVLLPLVWALYRWDELPVGRFAARFLGLSGAAFGVYFGLRTLLGHHAAYAEFNDFALNLRSLNSYLYFVLLFGALAVPALKGLPAKPKFLRRLALFLPFFLVFHFVIPIFQETRVLLPIFPILLALALTSFWPPPAEVFAEEEPPVISPLARRGPALYAAALASFVAGIFLYLAYLERAHMDEFRERQKAEGHIRRGYEAYEQGGAATAVREWEWGLLGKPNDYEVRFNLALLYGEKFFDVDRALRHLNVCKRLSPDDPKLPALEQRLNEIRRRREREIRTPS